MAAKNLPPLPLQQWISDRQHRLAETSYVERQRVVAFLRREAEALADVGLDGSAVSHLAGRIAQGAHMEDA